METISKNPNTVLSYDVSVEKREEELKRKFNEFKSAQLIVTDRLHGNGLRSNHRNELYRDQ